MAILLPGARPIPLYHVEDLPCTVRIKVNVFKIRLDKELLHQQAIVTEPARQRSTKEIPLFPEEIHYGSDRRNTCVDPDLNHNAILIKGLPLQGADAIPQVTPCLVQRDAGHLSEIENRHLRLGNLGPDFRYESEAQDHVGGGHA